MKGGNKKRSGPLNPLGITSARWEGACNNSGRYNNKATFLSVPLWSEVAISDQMQISNIWKTTSFLPTLDPISCMQIAQRTGEWVAATILRAKITINCAFTFMPSPGICKPTVDSRVANIVTLDRFCQCLGARPDSWCFLLFHLPQPLVLETYFSTGM